MCGHLRLNFAFDENGELDTEALRIDAGNVVEQSMIHVCSKPGGNCKKWQEKTKCHKCRFYDRLHPLTRRQLPAIPQRTP